jgi:primosomal protein N' (replication factor Y)
VAGEVIIQTYTPTHPAVQAARRGDFDVFIDEELEARKALYYPPYCRLICVHFRGEQEQQVDFVSGLVYEELDRMLGSNPKVNLAPPVPSPIARIQKNYRYQMIARVPKVKQFTRPLRQVLASLKLPRQVQIVVDVDAISLM